MLKPLLSLAHMAVLELTPPQVVVCAAAAGFTGANLRLGPARLGERPWPLEAGAPMMRETLAALRDTGVVVSDVELIRLQAQTRADEHDMLFNTAARLGARRVIAVGDDADHARLADRLAAVCERAVGHGLRIELEFMVFTEVKNLAQALAVLRAAGQPNAGLLLDPLHLARSGSPFANIAALDPALLSFVQLCDAPAQAPQTAAGIGEEARFDRLLPGEGGLPLGQFFAALPPGLDVSVETPLAHERGRLPPLTRARLMADAARRCLQQTGYT
ncbi:MAG: sugar phosphate isomerase/epimerase [Burkholderiaceae bacterium]|nr:sugar phosphate isomerase/epimerase [Burkholderiaceae bacterium]